MPVPSEVDVAAYDSLLKRLLNMEVQYTVDSLALSSLRLLYFMAG